MFSRAQVRQVTGLLTGHCHLMRHLLKMDKVSYPICRKWYLETETASQILCD